MQSPLPSRRKSTDLRGSGKAFEPLQGNDSASRCSVAEPEYHRGDLTPRLKLRREEQKFPAAQAKISKEWEVGASPSALDGSPRPFYFFIYSFFL